MSSLPPIPWSYDPRRRWWTYQANGVELTVFPATRICVDGLPHTCGWDVVLRVNTILPLGTVNPYTTAASARRGAARLIRRLDRIAAQADLPLFSGSS